MNVQGLEHRVRKEFLKILSDLILLRVYRLLIRAHLESLLTSVVESLSRAPEDVILNDLISRGVCA